MLEVTRVGSFYSFLAIMCRADPEQAGVLFSCSEAEWAWGSSPAAAGLGLCPWREAAVPGSRATRWPAGRREQDSPPLVHTRLVC